MSLEPGSRLDAYGVIRLLGAGCMGEVYRAKDSRLHRDVAIKVMQAGCAASPDRLRRFRQEALAIAALNHPNILVVYDTGQSDGAPYVVTELLDGETLADRLTKGALPLRKTVDCAIQIANGLAAAHAKGIVHRDLKPDNVFLTRDERVKILDFGLAKLTDPGPAFTGSATRAATEPGLMLGTVGYMSPEQVRGEPADHRSDVFSFGALIYEMASGRPVFGRETAPDTLSAILHEDPPDLTTYAGISPALERIVRRCLEKNPEERFQSARDVGFALEALSGVTTPASGARTISVRSGARERLAWVIAVAAVTACAATLSLALKYRPGEPAATSLVRFSVLPMERTTFASTETAAETPQLAVSPNGRYVVFAAGKRGERPRLWLRALDSLALMELAGTDDASFPFWSPDSRYIGFFTAGSLKKVAATGESSQTVCDVPTGRGGTWGADGTILFAANIGDGPYRVAAAGGVPTPVTKLDAARQESSHRWPQFLPDGRHFLFVVRGARAHAGIYVAALDSPERTRLLGSDVSFATVAAGHAFFVKAGSLLAQPFDATRLRLTGDPLPVAEQVASGSPSGFAAFGVSESGVLAYAAGSTASRQLTWFDRRGRALAKVGVAGEYLAPVLSPDGKHIAVGRIDTRMRTPDIWLIDLARGNSTRFTYSPAGERLPLWSPDGDYILFASTIRGPWDFYRKPSSGGADPELVLESSADKFPTDWSADGRFIVFTVSQPRDTLGYMASSTVRLSNTRPVPANGIRRNPGLSLSERTVDGVHVEHVWNHGGLCPAHVAVRREVVDFHGGRFRSALAARRQRTFLHRRQPGADGRSGQDRRRV